MVAKLSWEKKNIANIILFNEYKNIVQRGKRIKNNQFNIKWMFNKTLTNLYQTTKLSPNIESRLDILLFRTNWFINKEAVIKYIKSGYIKINNQTIHSSHFHLKAGYLITLDHLSIDNSLIQSSGNLGRDDLSYARARSMPSRTLSHEEWLKNRKYNMIPNMPYLEINNNIKGIIILKKPVFKNIPVPFNLHRAGVNTGAERRVPRLP